MELGVGAVMNEELAEHLDLLIGLLEAEVDLHGGRTEMAFNLRTQITELLNEIEGLKSAQ